MKVHYLKPVIIILALLLVSLAIAATVQARLWHKGGTTIYYTVDHACTDGMIFSVAGTHETATTIPVELSGMNLKGKKSVLSPVMLPVPEDPVEIPGAGLISNSGTFPVKWDTPLVPGTRVRLFIEVENANITTTDIFNVVHDCRLTDMTKLPVRHLFGKEVGFLSVPPNPEESLGSKECVPGVDVTTSTLTIVEDVVIDDLNVALGLMEHETNSGMEVTVTSPQGTTVTLIARETKGGTYSFGSRCYDLNGNLVAEDMADFILDDSSTFDLNVPTRTWEHNETAWQPTGPGSLGDFSGENAAGTWTLDVCDTTPDIDEEARLACWYLEIWNYPTVGFARDTYEANETDGTVMIEVALSETSGDYTKATYTTVPEPGSNQIPTSGTVKFAPRTVSDPGEKMQYITIPIIDDEIEEADETVLIKLSDPTNQYSIGDIGEAQINIRDNDAQDSASLTIDVVGNGDVFKEPDKVVYEIGETVMLTAVPDPDHVFSQWSGDLSGIQNPQSIVMSGDRTVVAAFIMGVSAKDSFTFVPFLLRSWEELENGEQGAR